MFNEIDEDFNDMAIRTFKVGLPTEHDLRKSLTRKHKERGKPRWFLRSEGILGRRGTITVDPGEILLGTLGLLLPK